jgi:hypothetical protein
MYPERMMSSYGFCLTKIRIILFHVNFVSFLKNQIHWNHICRLIERKNKEREKNRVVQVFVTTVTNGRRPSCFG